MSSSESHSMEGSHESSSEEWWQEWRERITNATGNGYDEFWSALEDRESSEESGERYWKWYAEDLEGGVAFLTILFVIVTTILAVIIGVMCCKLKKARSAAPEPSKPMASAYNGPQDALPPKQDHTYITVQPENPRETLEPRSPPPQYQ